MYYGMNKVSVVFEKKKKFIVPTLLKISISNKEKIILRGQGALNWGPISLGSGVLTEN